MNELPSLTADFDPIQSEATDVIRALPHNLNYPGNRIFRPANQCSNHWFCGVFSRASRMTKTKIIGTCSRCGKHSSLPGYCHDCKQKHRDYCRKRTAMLRENGLCMACGQHPLHTKRLCEICLNKRRERKAKLSSEGRCHACTKPRDISSNKLCSSCIATKKKCDKSSLEHRTSIGVCVVCGTSDGIVAASLSTRPHCESCVFKRTAHNATGLWSQGQLIEDLFNQQGRRCAYTGRPLELGVNASLDHKCPRSKYPELRAAPSNLQWVDSSINSMKHDMTHEQFISICAEVTARQCQ